MKNVQVTPAQYEMLMALCKKWNMKAPAIVGEWCEENYHQVFKKKR